MKEARFTPAHELASLRTWLGLVAASLTGSLAGAAILWLNMTLTGNHSYLTGPYIGDPLFALAVGVIAGGLIGIPAALVIGWPLHVALQRRGITRLPTYLAIGCAFPLMINLLFVVSARHDLPFGDGITLTACLAAGIVAGLVFWFIRRPDKVRHDRPVQ